MGFSKNWYVMTEEPELGGFWNGFAYGSGISLYYTFVCSPDETANPWFLKKGAGSPQQQTQKVGIMQSFLVAIPDMGSFSLALQHNFFL